MSHLERLSGRQVFFILLALASLVIVPYVGLYLSEGKIPEGFFKYPPLEAREKPGFNMTVFTINAIVALVIILLYFFPRIFGFKQPKEKAHFRLTKKYLPVWFWAGLIIFIVPLTLLSMQAKEPWWLINWALLPIFWGFTILLDGLVFYVNDGKSLISKNPTELVALGIVSISGWMFFDYLNFFIGRNWFYPKAYLLDNKSNEFFIYAVIGSSGFIPMAFQWYYLLRKVKVLNTKYSNGPKIRSRQWILWSLILISLVGLAFTPVQPDDLFFILWLGPLIIIGATLTLLKVWTPFTSIREGNWTALLTFALTYLIQGFLLEWWNYMSAERVDNELVTYNAAYWVYSLPFIHKFKVFEMPVLGYMGYLFFSIHCYLWWIVSSKLLGIQANFGDQEDFK